MTTFEEHPQYNDVFTIRFVTPASTTTSDKESDKIEYDGFQWYLLARTLRKKQPGTLSLFLYCNGNGAEKWEVNVRPTMRLIGEKEDVTKTRNKTFTQAHKAQGFYDVITLPSLQSGGYIKDGNITIECCVAITAVSGKKIQRKHKLWPEDKDFNTDLLTVGGKEFHVNGSYLSAYSLGLRDLFYPTHNRRSLAVSGQVVDDVTSDDFEQFLKYAYHLEEIDKNNVELLLQLSERFRNEKAQKECVEFLISTDDVAKYTKLEYADKFNLKDLQTSTLESIKTSADIKEINEHADNLSRETLRALLRKSANIME